jgi:hypothetical protein
VSDGHSPGRVPFNTTTATRAAKDHILLLGCNALHGAGLAAGYVPGLCAGHIQQAVASPTCTPPREAVEVCTISCDLATPLTRHPAHTRQYRYLVKWRWQTGRATSSSSLPTCQQHLQLLEACSMLGCLNPHLAMQHEYHVLQRGPLPAPLSKRQPVWGAHTRSAAGIMPIGALCFIALQAAGLRCRPRLLSTPSLAACLAES